MSEAVMIRIGRTWHRTGGRTARMPAGYPHCKSDHVIRDGRRGSPIRR